MSGNFDQIAVVVDWLDACRRRDLAALLDLYGRDACLECRCDGSQLVRGRVPLEAYWRSRLGRFASSAFGLEEITPTADGVVLDYSGPDGRPVRIVFAFTAEGKIRHTSCGPAIAIAAGDCTDPQPPAA